MEKKAKKMKDKVEDIHDTVREHMKQTKEKLQIVRDSLINNELDLHNFEIQD